MLETWRGPNGVRRVRCQVTNNNCIDKFVVGTAVIVLGGPTCALVARPNCPRGVAAYSIAVPIGSVFRPGPWGVICDVGRRCWRHADGVFVSGSSEPASDRPRGF